MKLLKKLFKKKMTVKDPYLEDTNSILEDTIKNTLNLIIQSPDIQGMTFKVSSECDKTSVINDIEFCNEVYVHDSYSWEVANDACVSACKATKDLAYSTCDATRQTCKAGCDVIEASYEACKIACCYGCIWGKTCSCDSVKKEYDNCNNSCNDMSSDCKSGADSMYNGCVDACGYLTMTGGYEFRLMNIKGVGTIQVTNVYDIIAQPGTQNVFSVSMDLNVPQVTANSYYKVWQDPIPAMSGNLPVIANNVTGKATGILTIICDFENPDKSGYYLQIDSIDITIPTNVFDSNLLFQLVEIYSKEIEYYTGGIVKLDQMLLDMADGLLANEVEGILNDILKDYKLLSVDCTTLTK